MRCWRLAATLWLAVAGGVLPSAAEEFRLLVLDGGWVKWGAPVLGTPAAVTYVFVTEPTTTKGARNCRSLEPLSRLSDGRISEAELRSQAGEAFRVWEEVAALRFEETQDPETADILIGAQGIRSGLAFTNVALVSDDPAARPGEPPTLAGTGRDLGSGPPRISAIRQALICLNPEERWKVGFDGNLETYDLKFTFTHEIGHAIGLDHPGPTGALMGFRYDERSATLKRGDIAAARMLYGPPAGAEYMTTVPGR